MTHPLAADLEHILQQTQLLWQELRGQRIFVTGGTGFFGCWLLESLIWAEERFRLGLDIWVLARDPDAFCRNVPHLTSHPAIHLHHGDVRTYEAPPGSFAHVIHAATTPSATLNDEAPLEMFDVIVDGTRHTLDVARHCGARSFFYISSGLVYGRQPTEMTHIPEEHAGAPDPLDPRSAYGEGKRAAELLCRLYARECAFEAKVARCFSFMGAYQPLDADFAIGNFIRDGINGQPIQVKGDGTTYRSYLYAADLVIWLWHIFFRGVSGRVYNVGSEEAVTISELAHLVADCFEPRPDIRIAKQLISGQLPEHYIPSTRRARSELQLTQTVDLKQAVRKSVQWHLQDMALKGAAAGSPGLH